LHALISSDLPRIWLVFGYIFFTYGCITFFLFSLPLQLAEAEIGYATIGPVLAVMWLSFSVISMLLREMLDGRHLSKIILLAPVFIGAGVFLSQKTGQPARVLPAAVAVGAGFSCSNAPSTHMVLELAPTHLRSMSASLNITCARLGGVATVALFADAEAYQAVVGVAELSIAAVVCAWFCEGDNEALRGLSDRRAAMRSCGVSTMLGAGVVRRLGLHDQRNHAVWNAGERL